MKKKLIYPLACLALLAASCDSNETTPAAPQDGEGPTVTFSVNSETKAADGTLTDIFYPTEQNGVYIGKQHAKYVYLYIFRGSDSNATCVACENVGWNTYWETLPENTAEMTYTIQYDNFIYAQPYTLMAVGLSDGAQNVYGFPTGITVEADGVEGTTLGSALAELQSGKTCADIHTAEVYAGTAVYTPDGNNSNTTIDLWRRVAAVAGYFKNAPSQAATLRISLYKEQNTKLPLMERQQAPIFLDYEGSPTEEKDGEVLVKIELKDGETAAGASYVLPVPAPESGNTLRIEALKADGTVIRTWHAKLPEGDELDPGITGGGTGIIDSESAYRFPIVANHFYALGSPDSPIDLLGNGANLLITIDPAWKHEENLGITEGTTN